jgi:cytochrome c-type biogenesis protein
MINAELMHWVVLPVGLGLLGFVEPCSMGATLLFIKTIEEKSAAAKAAQVGVFTMLRAFLMGMLGLGAALVGAAFWEFQKGMWIAFGAVYILIGTLYAAGKSGLIVRPLGINLERLSGLSGAAALGAVFALNIPACAGPLILALLGIAAAGGAGGASLWTGFASLLLFGLALSLPLVLAVLFARARKALDWLAGLSRRAPFWSGAALIILGLWSIWFGLFVSPGNMQ